MRTQQKHVKEFITFSKYSLINTWIYKGSLTGTKATFYLKKNSWKHLTFYLDIVLYYPFQNSTWDIYPKSTGRLFTCFFFKRNAEKEKNK